jgi:hypothetical protein
MSTENATPQIPLDKAASDLLLAVARHWTDTDPSRLRLLAEQVADWDSLLNLAQSHRMLPALYIGLAHVGPVIPQSVRERLRAEYECNVFHCLASAAELLDLLGSFNQAGIPAMPFKGIVLAASAYRDLTARPAGDLDLLIDPADLARAASLLVKRGYQLITPVHPDGMPVIDDTHEYVFERYADGRVVELRWKLDLVYLKFRHDLGMNWVWRSRTTANVAGSEVPNLSPEIALLVLCMHGSKHVWSRLIWICDVARLLASSRRFDWELTMHEAKRSGLWRSLALGVLLAHRIAGAAIPQQVLRRFDSSAAAHKLARHFEEHLFDQSGVGPVGLIPYNIQLLDLSDRFSLRLWRSFLTPNERDQASFPLPKPLRILHYLFRPLRILLDRSPR